MVCGCGCVAGYVGVTEGQVVQMGIEIVTAIYGHGLWDAQV